jgi:hypothetical protein
MGSEANDKCRRQKQRRRKGCRMRKLADAGEHDLIRLDLQLARPDRD